MLSVVASAFTLVAKVAVVANVAVLAFPANAPVNVPLVRFLPAGLYDSREEDNKGIALPGPYANTTSAVSSDVSSSVITLLLLTALTATVAFDT